MSAVARADYLYRKAPGPGFEPGPPRRGRDLQSRALGRSATPAVRSWPYIYKFYPPIYTSFTFGSFATSSGRPLAMTLPLAMAYT